MPNAVPLSLPVAILAAAEKKLVSRSMPATWRSRALRTSKERGSLSGAAQETRRTDRRKMNLMLLPLWI
jgi:hypothetical protein